MMEEDLLEVKYLNINMKKKQEEQVVYHSNILKSMKINIYHLLI